MREIWKDIEGYEGLYKISNYGNVYNVTNNFLLKRNTGNHGYERVILFKNGKKNFYLVHRLVAEAFIPNPNKLPQVNHIDENKNNNNVENLEWCDYKDNANHGTRNERSGLNRIGNNHVPKKVICLETKEVFESMIQASIKFYNTSNANGISRNIRGITKKYKNYTWMYYDEYLKMQGQAM